MVKDAKKLKIGNNIRRLRFDADEMTQSRAGGGHRGHAPDHRRHRKGPLRADFGARFPDCRRLRETARRSLFPRRMKAPENTEENMSRLLDLLSDPMRLALLGALLLIGWIAH